MNNLQKPDHLYINLLNFAYGINSDARFSWCNHNNISDVQSAYQIIIKSIDNPVLDTGWVVKKENTNIKVDNLDKKLKAGQAYRWKVRIKDQQGQISPFSDYRSFIYQQPKLPNKGIWLNDLNNTYEELPNLANTIFFRSPFFSENIDKVDQAYLYLIARGNEPRYMQGCDAFINGHSVGFGSARNQPNYLESGKNAVFYNCYPVKKYLDRNNVIALAATGTNVTNVDNSDPNSSEQKQTKNLRSVMATLIIKYKDGSQNQVTTDSSWKALDATNAFQDVGIPIQSQYFKMPAENVDNDFYPYDWLKTSYDDDNWPKAQVIDEPLISNDEVLLPFTSENTHRFEELSFKQTVKEVAPNDWLIDLGKEIIGSLKVRINSLHKQKVVVWCGEQLQNGHVRHHLAAGPDYIEVWHLNEGINEFNTFQIKNFRYVELRGYHGQVKLNDIIPWAIRQNFDDQEAKFECDNQLLNREYDLSKYTIKATNQDVYVDSQARERKPYEGDLLVNANTSYSVSRRYSLARHSIDYLIDNPTWPEDYRFFLLETVWQDYLYTGNEQLLSQRYQNLKDKFYFGKDKEDKFDPEVGLVTGMGLVDWPIQERDGFVEGKFNTPFNSVYAGACKVMSEIAARLGKTDDQNFFLKRYQIIKHNLIQKLYDKKLKKFYDSLNEELAINRHHAHHSSAYALAYNMFDSQSMSDGLSDFVFNNGKFVGSIYFIYFILRGLINAGHADQAVNLLLNDDPKDAKTFKAILDQLHATITPEAWNTHFKPNMTMSHPWGAAPGLTIVQGLLGIVPIEPGFDEFQISIKPGQLKKINALVPCEKGLIDINYTKRDNSTKLKIKVPMGSKAKVVIPKNSKKVKMNGKNLLVKQDLLINSGIYEIEY